MRRFSMVLAAAVVTGMIVIAISTLDAVGAGKSPAVESDLPARLAACMRDHGVAVPQLSSPALDRWLRTHEPPDEIARGCKMAVAGGADGAASRDELRGAATADAQKLIACLRAHGFDPPSDPMGLKRWIVTHE